MPEKIKAEYFQKQQEAMKAALIELVRIPSVLEEGADGYPFGRAINEALHKALEIAGGLGFRTRLGESGYYGIAEIGEGEEILGILGHLDVVPPGNLEDWTHDPFDPLEVNGMLYGRGTQDDKGPIMAALFAVKALMEAGATFHKRVRFIFGTDEETLWRCIRRYKETEELPDMGFSPDSRFPLTYAEKGLLQLYLEGPNESGLKLSGGSAFNAVPDVMHYTGERQNEMAGKLDELGFTYTRISDRIDVIGKAAHAMVPEDGINAITRLCIALDAIGSESRAVQFAAREIGEDPSGTRIFGALADVASGRLKINVGKITLNETEKLSIDIRIPVTIPKSEIVARLSDSANRYGLEYREYEWLAPLYVSRDHFIIETLMQVYRKRSGDMISQPASTGGATYARAFENCVAFGALTFDEPETEHQPNERAVLKNLYKAMDIYTHAVYELAVKA